MIGNSATLAGIVNSLKPTKPRPVDETAVLRETFVQMVRTSDGDLTMRQMAVFLTVYQADEFQTVRGLAAHLNISKPAITRALNRLCQENLAQRQVDKTDRRSIFVRRTAHGSSFAATISATLTAARRAVGA